MSSAVLFKDRMALEVIIQWFEVMTMKLEWYKAHKKIVSFEVYNM